MKYSLLCIVCLIAVLFFLESCTHDKGELTPQAKPISACDTLNVTFSATIDPIIQTNCISCHGLASPDGDFTTYNGVKAKVDNGTFANRVLVLKDMPPSPPLSTSDLQKIQCWIDAGAPNN